MTTQTLSIAEVLADIYTTMPWQNQSVHRDEVVKYYYNMIEKGNVYYIERNGRLIGYYERRIEGDTCFLINVYIVPDEILGNLFPKLCKHFFRTLPEDVKMVYGEKQKLGGKIVFERIHNTRRR